MDNLVDDFIIDATFSVSICFDENDHSERKNNCEMCSAEFGRRYKWGRAGDRLRNWSRTSSNLRGVTDDSRRQKMVVRERMMRVTSKHSFSRRGFFLVYSLVRLVGKPVERVEPHDLWIRTALHRSTYVLQLPSCTTDEEILDYFPVTRLERLPTISTSPSANDATGCPVCTNVLYYIGQQY